MRQNFILAQEGALGRGNTVTGRTLSLCFAVFPYWLGCHLTVFHSCLDLRVSTKEMKEMEKGIGHVSHLSSEIVAGPLCEQVFTRLQMKHLQKSLLGRRDQNI